MFLVDDVSSAAQDVVPDARAAVQPQQQGDPSHRGAQGEHLRRRQGRQRAQAEPAHTRAALRTRHDQPQHEVRQEERARQDRLAHQVPQRERTQTQDVSGQAEERASDPQAQLEQDAGGGRRREGEGEPAVRGRRGVVARLRGVRQAQQAMLRAHAPRHGRAAALSRAGVVVVGRAAGHVGARGGRHGAGRGRGGARPQRRQAPLLRRARAAEPQEDPPQDRPLAPRPRTASARALTRPRLTLARSDARTLL